MALNATVLQNLMKTKIEAIPNFPTSGMSPIVSDPRILGAIAAAIVEHVQADGTVQPGTFANGAGNVLGEGTIV